MSISKFIAGAATVAFITVGASAAYAQAAKKATAPGQGTYTGQNVYKKTNPSSQAGKGQKPRAGAAKKTRIAPSADRSRVHKSTSQSKSAGMGKKPTAASRKAVKSYNRQPTQENPGVNTKPKQ